MAIENISSANTSYQQVVYSNKQVNPAPQTSAEQNQDKTQTPTVSDQVQIKHSSASKNLDAVRAIEMMHARLNELAKGARETNEALASATDKIDQTRAQLATIIKNYPPFPLDNKERQEILMSYAGIRKEIEQLMVPPPPKPIYETVKHLWDSMFGENGQMLSSAVPKLDTSSNDQQVKDAADKLARSNEGILNLSSSITNALIKG